MTCIHQYTTSNMPDYERCRSCGTYHSLAVTPPEKMKNYWSANHSTVWEQAWNVDQHLENGVSKNRFVLDRIECKRGTALDIGCAPGRLLFWLQHYAGFKAVVGIEPDEERHYAIRKVGGFDGALLGGFFPHEIRWGKMGHPFFDCVVALDVFEHSPEPEEFLSECFKILAPGGQLLLMLPLAGATPVGSMSFKASEHVYLHSLLNMGLLLEDAGFRGAKHDRWTVGHDTVTARKP